MKHILPRWVIGTFIGLFVMAGGAIAAWSIEVPYFAFSPGPVGDALDAVATDGSVDVFQPDGELFFLTVSLQQINLYEAFSAAVDPTVDLVRRQAVRRDDESDEEFKQRNLDSMQQSIDRALAVALDRSGVDVVVESDGVEVVEVIDGSGSDGVLEPGDIIVSIDGELVQLSADIGVVIGVLDAGSVVELEILRDDESMAVEIELSLAEDGSRPLIGISARTANPRLPITIETANIGGPSAGMMYTLAIMDLLVPGDLSKGNIIAGTGTISSEGLVGNIGGIRQKVVAAEAAGAALMLVPEGNYEEALTAPRTDMDLIPVATIDDALAALDALEPA